MGRDANKARGRPCHITVKGAGRTNSLPYCSNPYSRIFEMILHRLGGDPSDGVAGSDDCAATAPCAGLFCRRDERYRGPAGRRSTRDHNHRVYSRADELCLQT